MLGPRRETLARLLACWSDREVTLSEANRGIVLANVQGA